MKLFKVISLTTFALFALSSCSRPTHESVTEGAVEVMEEMAEIMEGVDDEDSAKAAAKKIDKLADRMEKLKKQRDELGKPSQEEDEALKKKYEERMGKAMSRFLVAMAKLQSKPELQKHLEGSMKRLNGLD